MSTECSMRLFLPTRSLMWNYNIKSGEEAATSIFPNYHIPSPFSCALSCCNVATGNSWCMWEKGERVHMCVARWMGQIWLFGWMHVGGETGNGAGYIKDRRLGREGGRVFCVSGAPIRFPVFGSKCAFRCLCVLPHNTSTRNCIGCFAASLSFFRESEIFINFPPHPTLHPPHFVATLLSSCTRNNNRRFLLRPSPPSPPLFPSKNFRRLPPPAPPSRLVVRLALASISSRV